MSNNTNKFIYFIPILFYSNILLICEETGNQIINSVVDSPSSSYSRLQSENDSKGRIRFSDCASNICIIMHAFVQRTLTKSGQTNEKAMTYDYLPNTSGSGLRGRPSMYWR